MESLHSALQRVEELLGRYSAPKTEPCKCDACAADAILIEQGMRQSQSKVSREEIRAAVWSVYTGWCADWPEFAHFIPAALRFVERDSAFDLWLSIDLEMLLSQLLVSARPEMNPGFGPDRPMQAEERAAIYNAFGALMLHKAASSDKSQLRDELTQILGFLAQFHAPVGPFLEAWQNDSRSLVRARLCSVMAASVLQTGKRPFFRNSYLKDSFLPMAENENSMAQTFGPAHVAQYLLDHVDDIESLDEDERYEIELGANAAMHAAM